MYKQINEKLDLFISYAVFFAALGAVLLLLTNVIFPSLIMRTMGHAPDFFGNNPFEIGIMAVPLLITNFAILGIVILHFKKRLPQRISNAFKFILNFEISSRIALLIIILVIGGYITFTVNQLYTPEPFPDYYNRLKPIEDTWTIDSVMKGWDQHLRYFLDIYSKKIFGSDRVIPYLSSIGLLITTYFFTKFVTKSRFAGIVAMILVLQSAIFLTYSSSATYEDYWILFCLLSFYTIYKFWPLSSVSYIASELSKPLVIMFIPFFLFYLYRSGISFKRKMLILLSFIPVAYVTMGLVTGLGGGAGNLVSGATESDLWSAYNAFTYQLRFDPVLILFLLPVIVLLFMKVRKGAKYAVSFLSLILGSVMFQPLNAAIAHGAAEPYRNILLVTFFAIGVGVLLTRDPILKE